MYTFPQLLMRNATLALIFILSFSLLSLSMLSSLLEDNSIAHKKAISALTKHLSSTDASAAPQLIATALAESALYQSLTITDSTGTNLAEVKHSEESFISTLINPDQQSLRIKKVQLSISYQLDFSKELSLVLTIIYSAILLTLSVLVFSTVMSTKRHKAVFTLISQKIKQDLAIVNHTDFVGDKNVSADDDILEIPELKQGIADIKQLMTQQLESVISLEKEAYVDHLTHLDNRGRFVQFYESQIVQDSPVKFGVLCITRCSELQTINQIHGFKAGDKYIVEVANIIQHALAMYPDGKLFRLNSSDFAFILPNVKIKEAEKLANTLTERFNMYQQASNLDSVAYSGLVPFDKTKPLGELLALVDTGVSVAQTQSSNAWYSQTDSDILQNKSSNYGNQNWRQEIDSVLENQRVTLLLQPILPSGRNTKVYGEILARFLNANDEMLPTASFVAMAEKLDKIIAVDKLIIETTIKEIINKNMLDNSFGINISARSVSDEHFMIWLERKLLREPHVAPRLIFEISEYGLQQNIKTSKRLIDMLHRVGARVTVERFGVGLTSFKFFRDLTPDYIKMDSSYTRDIDDDKNNQYFLRLMVDLAHRLSINVLAESVESQEEKHTLEKLFIDGCQGFYIGKPTPL